MQDYGAECALAPAGASLDKLSERPAMAMAKSGSAVRGVRDDGGFALLDRREGVERDLGGAADGAGEFVHKVGEGCVHAEAKGEGCRIKRGLGVAIMADDKQQTVVIEQVSQHHDHHHPTVQASPG